MRRHPWAFRWFAARNSLNDSSGSAGGETESERERVCVLLGGMRDELITHCINISRESHCVCLPGCKPAHMSTDNYPVVDPLLDIRDAISRLRAASPLPPGFINAN